MFYFLTFKLLDKFRRTMSFFIKFIMEEGCANLVSLIELNRMVVDLPAFYQIEYISRFLL